MKLVIDGQAHDLVNKNELAIFLASLFAGEYQKADENLKLLAKPISRAVLLSMERHTRARGEGDPLMFRPSKGEDPNILLLKMAIALAVGHSEYVNIEIATDGASATIALAKREGGEDNPTFALPATRPGAD